MAITTTVIGKKHNATTFKIVATASLDAATIPLSTTITIVTPGNITFTPASFTITRATGSWITDGVTVGSVLVVAGTASNNGSFIVKSVTASNVVIESDTSSAVNKLVTEVVAATFTGSYKSDLLSYGQIIDGNLQVNIARVRYSVSSTGDVTVTRNSVVVLKLFGHDELECPTSEFNTFPIVSTFTGTAGGTLILEVTKVAGFSSINPAQLSY